MAYRRYTRTRRYKAPAEIKTGKKTVFSSEPMSLKKARIILSNASESKFWMDSLNIDLASNPLPEFIYSTYLLKMTTNFVKLTCGRDIDVKFDSQISTGGTDFKTIKLSANIENPDSTIGLALHEASHILHTSPGSLTAAINSSINCSSLLGEMLYTSEYIQVAKDRRLVEDANRTHNAKYIQLSTDYPKTMGDHAASILYKILIQNSKLMWNWLEDRRIDSKSTNSFKGYTSFYEALYKNYFFTDSGKKIINAKIDIDDIFNNSTADNLDSKLSSIVDFYLCKMFQFINPYILKKVKHFDPLTSTLWKLVNIQNYGKNIDTEVDVMLLFSSIHDTIYDYLMAKLNAIPYNDTPSTKSKAPKSTKASKESKSENKDNNDSSNLPLGKADEDTDSMVPSEDESEEESVTLDSENFDNEKYVIKEAKEEIKEVLDPKKNYLNKVQGQLLEQINSSEVKVDKKSDFNVKIKPYGLYIDNVTVNRLDNLSHMFSNAFSFYISKVITDAITRGYTKGKLLAKKINFRNDVKNVTMNRLKSGNLTDRIISELPYNSKVFSIKHQIKYKAAYIHLSIDGSGSMSGTETEVYSMTASIISAIKELKGVDLKISFRSESNGLPLTIIVYDSKKHTLNDFKTIAGRLSFNSNTPEGLCFHSLYKSIKEDAKGKTAFFINMSDGEPGTATFGTTQLVEYTKKYVSKMAADNINILSYFISRCDDEMNSSFIEMYGKSNCHIISPDNLAQIGITINNKLIKSEKTA